MWAVTNYLDILIMNIYGNNSFDSVNVCRRKKRKSNFFAENKSNPGVQTY